MKTEGSKYKDCYYKQLKRLEQERDELKRTVENQKLEYEEAQCDINTLVADNSVLYKQINELKQKNENLKKEVKQIGSDFIKKGDYARELEQENKELKEKYSHVLELAKTNADSNEYCLQELEEKCKQLRSALEEINRVVRLAHKVDDYLLGQDYTVLVDRIEKELEVLQ